MLPFRFAYTSLLIGAIIALIAGLLLRWFIHKPSLYRFSLGSWLKKHGHATKHPHRALLALIRFTSLALLAMLVGKPQLIDTQSKIKTDGIDIMLALDASGSMFQCRDAGENRTRFEVAQQEAVRFIEKRTNDAIGLVLFGKEAASRCPLTIDKQIVKEMVKDVKLGDIDPDGTALSTALATAANRLKKSTAQSKIIILLTDGEPSPHDIKPALAIEIAQKMNIKIYTVGFGSQEAEVMLVPGYGLVPKPTVNKELLEAIALQTGGQCFMARNAQEMRAIYETIDRLETTEHETTTFSKYYDIFLPVTMATFALCFLELFLQTFVWFSV